MVSAPFVMYCKIHVSIEILTRSLITSSLLVLSSSAHLAREIFRKTAARISRVGDHAAAAAHSRARGKADHGGISSTVCLVYTVSITVLATLVCRNKRGIPISVIPDNVCESRIRHLDTEILRRHDAISQNV